MKIQRETDWGPVLDNGALVLEHSNGIVLCKWKKNEYATWKLDSNGNTYAGYYFMDLRNAYDNFKKRMKEVR
jgi:hypothetical protein